MAKLKLNEEPRSKLLGIFVGEEIYYTGVIHTQIQRSSKTVLGAAIFPEQAPGYGPRLPIKQVLKQKPILV
jgi:hypothetical protein